MNAARLLVPLLSRTGHDRAAEHRNDDAWLGAQWASAAVLLLSPDLRTPVQVGADGRRRLRLLAGTDVEAEPSARLFLGIDGAQAYFALSVAGTGAQWAGDWLGLRDVGADLDDLEAGLLTTAVALATWHAAAPFSSRDGAPTEVVHSGWARRDADGRLEFPRTDAAVIMLVHDGADRCVLARGPQWGPGRFSILAGFVEAGESLEATVAREVYEEVGLRVRDVRYVASQPWPFPRSLMVGFTAQVDGDQTITLRDGELVEAHWFERAEIRRAVEIERTGGRPESGTVLQGLPGGISIARQIIEAWLGEPAG